MKNECKELSNGVHYLSGVGYITFADDWGYGDIEGYLFKIDDVVYIAYLDPDDGYRSYGHIAPCTLDCKCQFEFPPQKVIVQNYSNVQKRDEDGYLLEDLTYVTLTDAVTNKEILSVGTDYAEDYYPMAIFKYSPENMSINSKLKNKFKKDA